MTAITTVSQAMSVLAEVRRALDESVDFDQVRELRDWSEAILHYVKTAALGLEMQNRAAEVKLLCERRVGQLLRDLPLHGGDRKSEHRVRGVTLEQLGIDNTKSSRWQRIASVTEEEFAKYVRLTRQEGRELTSHGLLRLARLHADAAKTASDEKNPFSRLVDGLRNLARQQKRFACIYAEPTWSGGGKGEIARLPQGLFNLPVKLVAARQAHLYLLVSPESLGAGLNILRAWGFRYKTMAVRRKSPTDRRNHGQSAQELLLLGVRGRLPFGNRVEVRRHPQA